MAWIHDTGYGPAYDHPGFPVAVLLDGSETSGSSAGPAPDVIGWRSACGCGWRGMEFYSRREWPSTTGLAVDGGETGAAAFAEWDRHLDRVLPELLVHDLARQLAEVEERVRVAVQAARFAGLPWSRIRAVAPTVDGGLIDRLTRSSSVPAISTSPTYDR